jgi:outer membrane protein TolC
VALIVFGVQAQGLRTSDVVRIVLERQPQLSEDSIGLLKAHEQVSLVPKQAILPKFEVQVGFAPAPGFRYSYTYDTTNGVVNKTDSTRHYAWWPLGPAFGTNVTVAQPLNVGKLRAGMRAAHAGERLAATELDGQRQTETKKALEYLFGFQYANRMSVMLEEAMHRIDSIQDAMQKKLDNDEEDASQTDLFQLKIGRFELERSLQEAHLGRDRAREGLAFSMALPSPDSLHLADSLIQPLPELPTWDSLSTDFSHPDLRRLQAGLDAKAALLDLQRTDLGPDIYLFAKFSYTKAWVANRNQQNQDVLITDPLNDVSGEVGIGFTWRLNFWSELGSVRMAELDWQQLRRKQAYASTGLRAQMKDVWLRYRMLGERVEAADRGREAAESWLHVVAQQADIDAARSKDLVAPYKTWLDFQNKYWEAVYQRDLAALDVLLGSGLILRWAGLGGPFFQ